MTRKDTDIMESRWILWDWVSPELSTGRPWETLWRLNALAIPAPKQFPKKGAADHLQVCRGEGCNRLVPFDFPLCRDCKEFEIPYDEMDDKYRVYSEDDVNIDRFGREWAA